MNRLIIVCEGETEQEFCKDVLASENSHNETDNAK